MKVFYWNCNGGLFKKLDTILLFDADINIIVECSYSDIIKLKEQFNCLWHGDIKKGIGIFAKKEVNLKILDDWQYKPFRYFLPFSANGISIIAVWACSSYIEEMYLFQFFNFNQISKNTFFVGDFNSNKIWDKEHSFRNHSAVIENFWGKGLCSIYHLLSGEEQGKESVFTFFMYRHKDRCYHIDYLFACPDKIKDFFIGNFDDWSKYSDHVPLSFYIVSFS